MLAITGKLKLTGSIAIEIPPGCTPERFRDAVKELLDELGVECGRVAADYVGEYLHLDP